MDNITRIKHVSGRFRLFFIGLMICIPIADVIFWTMYNYLPASEILILKMDVSPNLDLATRFYLLLTSLIPVSVLIFAVFTLAQLFRLYEKGIVFSTSNVKRYRRLGYLIIFWVLALFIFTPLASLVVSINSPPGERFITIGFELLDVFTLITGAIVVLISWVMDEGRKLEDEKALTV